MHDHGGHDRGKHQGAETGPDHAAVAPVAVHLREDVTEDVGDRKEENPSQKCDLSDERDLEGGFLGGADEVRAQEHADVGGHHKIVVTVLTRVGAHSHGRSFPERPTMICHTSCLESPARTVTAGDFSPVDWRKPSHQAVPTSCTYVLSARTCRTY